MKRLLIVSHWYDPEPNVKSHTLAKHLVASGWQVQALTAFPSYPYGRTYDGYTQRPCSKEYLDGVEIIRVATLPDHGQSSLRRALSLCSFIASAALFGIWRLRRPDIIWSYETPFHTTVVARLLALVFRCPYVADVQDLWPETLDATGFRFPGWAKRMLRGITVSNHRRAKTVVVPSDGFKQNLVSKGVPMSKIRVVRNASPPSDAAGAAPLDAAIAEIMANRFNVVFAGNIGAAQGLEVMIEAAIKMRADSQVQFVIAGDGIGLAALQARVDRDGLENVRLLGRLPALLMPALFANADVLFLHLVDRPIFAQTIPSKLAGYLEAGKPILCAVAGDATELVNVAKCGLSCPPDNPEALAQAVIQLASTPGADLRVMGLAAADLHRQEFSREGVYSKYLAILEDAS